eukprot:gene22502-29628_t
MEEGTINFLSEGAIFDLGKAVSSKGKRSYYQYAGATIDLGKVLPSKEKRSYYQYAGSLTTPPCSEGLLWHVLDEASHISWKQYRALLMAVSDKDCTLKVVIMSLVRPATSAGKQYRSLLMAVSDKDCTLKAPPATSAEAVQGTTNGSQCGRLHQLKQYRALLMAVSDKDCTLKAEDTSKVPRASTGQMQYLRSSGSLQNLHR